MRKGNLQFDQMTKTSNEGNSVFQKKYAKMQINRNVVNFSSGREHLLTTKGRGLNKEPSMAEISRKSSVGGVLYKDPPAEIHGNQSGRNNTADNHPRTIQPIDTKDIRIGSGLTNMRYNQHPMKVLPISASGPYPSTIPTQKSP